MDNGAGDGLVGNHLLELAWPPESFPARCGELCIEALIINNKRNPEEFGNALYLANFVCADD